MSAAGQWALQVAIAVDQLANALLAGKADETLSARAYRTEQEGKRFGSFFRPLIDALFFWQAAHCRGAYASEKNRTQLPAAYKKA